MQKLTMMAVAMTAMTTTTWATPTQACSLIVDIPASGPSFADEVVPLNAELWLLNTSWLAADGFELTGPDGAVHSIAADFEGEHVQIAADVVLAPGAWVLRDAGNTEEWRFTVADTVDDAPPAPPDVAVERFTQGSPLALLIGCGDPIPRSMRRATVAVDPADVAWFVVNGQMQLPDGDVFTWTLPDDGSAVTVSAFDHAGNESEVVVADEGGGCASVPAVPMSLLALLLLAFRRRSNA